MTGHMPMFTQKLSKIFCFFDSDQISVYSDITVVSGITGHMEMTSHMPMFTQKLSNIFCFFDSDQISDICSFGVLVWA